MGYLDEEPFVHPHLTGREFLNFVADLYRMPRGAQRRAREWSACWASCSSSPIATAS